MFGTLWRDRTADIRRVKALLYRWVNKAYLAEDGGVEPHPC